jgi:hypothetical protein
MQSDVLAAVAPDESAMGKLRTLDVEISKWHGAFDERLDFQD